MFTFYRYFISPLIHFFTSTLSGSATACRFVPTCSEYFRLAVKKYGIIRGGILGFRRLSRCHPWSRSPLIDPVP